MGKAQSTEHGGRATGSNRPDGTNGANGGVQMRADKGGGKKAKQNRPMSYPGPSYAENVVSSAQPPTTTTDKIPVFNRASHNTSLAGRRHSQAFEEVSRSSINALR